VVATALLPESFLLRLLGRCPVSKVVPALLKVDRHWAPLKQCFEYIKIRKRSPSSHGDHHWKLTHESGCKNSYWFMPMAIAQFCAIIQFKGLASQMFLLRSKR
jgi:hypothetical protein